MRQNKPYVVGLTGSIASGKSSLARALANRGACVIDADRISRALTARGGPALGAIRDRFGEEFFREGELDRKKLGDLVFSNIASLRSLNAIMHPMIIREIGRRLTLLRRLPAVVIDVPLLFETGLDSLCDEIWCACVGKRKQVARLRRRDGLSTRQALRRIGSQMPARRKARLSDHVIDTGGRKRESAGRALCLWRGALRRARLG